MKDINLKKLHQDEVSEIRNSIKNHIGIEVENYDDGMVYSMEAVPLGISFYTRALAAAYDKEEESEKLRLGINLITHGTHVHDDIIGYIKEKEGSETVWTKYGLPHAINIGDGLVLEGFNVLAEEDIESEKKAKILELASESLSKNFRGQAMNINLKRKKVVTKEEAEKMLSYHIGSMGEFMFCAAGILGDETEEHIEILRKSGNKLACAWQIARDANLKEEEIKEGKKTFPVIKALKSASEEERSKLISILNKPNEEVIGREAETAINLIKKYDGVEFAKKEAGKLVDESIELAEKMGEKEEAVKQIIEYARTEYFSVPV